MSAMSWLEIFDNLANGSARYGEAHKALARKLRDLSERIPGFKKYPAWEDLVQYVHLTLYRNSPIALERRDEGSCRNYARRMLLNHWRSELRRIRPEEAKAPGGEPDGALESLADEEGLGPEQVLVEREQRAGQRFGKVRALLDRAFEEALAARSRRAHDEVARRSWRQIWELYLGEVQMRELLVRDESLDPDSGDFGTVRSRLFKRHQRVRDEVRQAIERMSAEGRIAEREANIAAKALEHLVRRQKTLPRSVSVNSKA
jgi:hypothetical protein